jgi:LemA protein
MPKKTMLLGCLGIVVLLVVILVGSVIGAYNKLVALDQQVQQQWAQVESQYQRRADLIPNLVETVKGAANFERETLQAVIDARSRVGQLSAGAVQNLTSNPEAFGKFQQAQDQLSSSLSRLMVVVERYPDLKATQNYRDFQVALEGTENRIAVERMRFNEAAQAFNTKRNTFPTVIIAGFFGSKFGDKSYFKSQTGAENAPKVNFGK